jgi:outer membrane protein insertion porin family
MAGSGMRRIALVVLAVVLASLARTPAARGVEVAVGAPVTAIEFECAAPIDRRGLSRLIPVQVGGQLQADTLAVARQRLEETDLFEQVAVESVPRDGGVALVVRLVRKSIVDSVRFQGNTTLGDDELRRAVRIQEQSPVTSASLDRAAQRIREKYAAEGFEAAVVTVEQSARAPGEVDLLFRIAEGEPTLVAAVEVPTALPITGAEIRERLGLAAGARWTKAGVTEARRRVIALCRERGYYEADVNLTWDLTSERAGTLRVEMQIGPPYSIDIEGNKHLPRKQFLKSLDLTVRPVITPSTWRELGRRAQHAYQEKGYYLARVETTVQTDPVTGAKTVRFVVSEGRRYRVYRIDFEGRHAVPASSLRSAMETGPPHWIPWTRGYLLDSVLADDRERLQGVYKKHGYLAARVLDTRVHCDETTGRITITVVLEEGRQTIVRNVSTSETNLLPQIPTLLVVPTKPLNPDDVDADRITLLTAFAAEGYTGVQVWPTVTKEPDGEVEAASVRYEVTPGERRRVGTIIVQNNFDTHRRVITRELPFKEGDPLSPQALLRGQANVYRLGLFRSVTVEPLAHTDNGGVAEDVGVNVSEKPPGTFQWGGGYNTRDGIRGFVDVGYSNLNGEARRINLRGEASIKPDDPGSNQYIASLGFREPRLARTGWTFRANLLAQRATQLIEPYSFERYALIPALEQYVRPGLLVGTDLIFEQNQVFDIEPDVLAYNPADQGRLRSIGPGPFLIYDRRDDPFIPTRGVFEWVRVKFAPGQLGSDVPFFKVTAQHSQYVPLPYKLVFVYALRGGWLRAYENGDKPPLIERFFLGGRTTVRGFKEDSIGPEGAYGNPLGGNFVVNTNTELRFPLYAALGGVVFVDGGGNYLTAQSISMHDFRRSAGTGLRYITPAGAISLEYGFKLDRRAGESVGQLHFSIGTIF